MKLSLGQGLLVLCIVCGMTEVWSRPLGPEELREERLAILRRLIDDMKELVVSVTYVLAISLVCLVY